MNKCNEDCFNCPYEDCILSDSDILKREKISDELERQARIMSYKPHKHKPKKDKKEYKHNYYQEHREELLDYQRIYYQNHKEKRRAYQRKYYQEHVKK